MIKPAILEIIIDFAEEVVFEELVEVASDELLSTVLGIAFDKQLENPVGSVTGLNLEQSVFVVLLENGQLGISCFIQLKIFTAVSSQKHLFEKKTVVIKERVKLK
ncbi:hypothetical protein HK099_007594 [Clydaea vesicula]|uniref:Uncharacterized protein n=1 Tax=Clydaea vesicula TaxID=447962 RepID=A0AAD5U6L8_9FUNG|nr:hypothetical protein HK099_007594 [Clydaea vesicula]